MTCGICGLETYSLKELAEHRCAKVVEALRDLLRRVTEENETLRADIDHYAELGGVAVRS